MTLLFPGVGYRHIQTFERLGIDRCAPQNPDRGLSPDWMHNSRRISRKGPIYELIADDATFDDKYS
jgi:hypothetical protein